MHPETCQVSPFWKFSSKAQPHIVPWFHFELDLSKFSGFLRKKNKDCINYFDEQEKPWIFLKIFQNKTKNFKAICAVLDYSKPKIFSNHGCQSFLKPCPPTSLVLLRPCHYAFPLSLQVTFLMIPTSLNYSTQFKWKNLLRLGEWVCFQIYFLVLLT